MQKVDAQDWLILFEAPDEVVGPSTVWARDYAEDPAHGWDECPRGDWLIAAAAFAGMSSRQVIATLHTLLSALFRAREAAGTATDADLARALEAMAAWLDGRAGATELAHVFDELIFDGSALARVMVFATADAARHAELGDDAGKEDLSLLWGAGALATHAGRVVRELDARMGGNARASVAALVRTYLPWETVAEAATTSELSRRRRAGR
jgi:hypothetical protein